MGKQRKTKICSFFTIFTKKGFEVLTEFSTCKQNIQTVYWDSYAIRSSTIFVNLFVYYESKWLKKMKKTDMRRATRISNIFRLTLLFDSVK